MVLFLPAQQSPNSRLAEQLGLGLGKGISSFTDALLQKRQVSRENEAAKRLGIDIEGLEDPETRRQLLINSLKGSQEEKLLGMKGAMEEASMGRKMQETSMAEQLKSTGEKKQKIAPFQAGLETIQRMRQLGEKGNLGRGSALYGFFGGETAKDRGEYEQLGKSLISLASSIPIRNKEEFETLAHNLYDPSIPDSQREGILDAMEQIIMRNMSPYLDEEEMKMPSKKRENRPSLMEIFGMEIF